MGFYMLVCGVLFQAIKLNNMLGATRSIYKVVKVAQTLNVRKFKVALNPMYRIFLNFAKSCVLSCLSQVDNI